jgi:hypothetical protein
MKKLSKNFRIRNIRVIFVVQTRTNKYYNYDNYEKNAPSST